MDRPISIVVPCFNHGRYILDAIESVEKCPEYLWELIVVNDGSTEPLTLQVFDDLRKKGYTVIDQQNKGLSTARNTGIRNASGKYILPLDADNKIRPAYLTKSIEILDSDESVGVVYGDREYFGEKDGVWKAKTFRLGELRKENYIDACAVFRKEMWKQIGGYDEQLRGYEDWDFWLCAADLNWKFQYVNEVLFDYRIRSDSMVRSFNVNDYTTMFRRILVKHSSWQGAIKYHHPIALAMILFNLIRNRTSDGYFNNNR